MTPEFLLDVATRIFLGLNVLPFLAVGAQALRNPQTVMDLVRTPLPTADARSSITGAYGGIPVVMALVLAVAAIVGDAWLQPALALLLVYTGGYALGRVIAWQRDGQLEAFARRWLLVETTVALLTTGLLLG